MEAQFGSSTAFLSLLKDLWPSSVNSNEQRHEMPHEKTVFTHHIVLSSYSKQQNVGDVFKPPVVLRYQLQIMSSDNSNKLSSEFLIFCLSKLTET